AFSTIFFLLLARPRCATLFPYTTLFRSPYAMAAAGVAVAAVAGLTYFGVVQAPPGTRTAPAGSPQALVERGHEVYVASKCQDCQDRKSTRLNSSHVKISYAVFCLKKKKK